MQKLTKEGNVRRNGFDYIAITKETSTRSSQTMFNQDEINEIKGQPFVEDVAPVIASQFKVQLSAGDLLPLTTDFFLETVNTQFLDTIPPSFTWQDGQETLPIIFSSDFFDIYNVVFAPGQSMPQFSRKDAMNIRFLVTCFGNGQQESFVAQIAAFSDRVNSVVVPETFLTWANAKFGIQKPFAVSRVFIKTKDANNPDLIKYLDSKTYSTNKEKTILGRNKMLIQNILSGMGIFGLVVVILALMLFSFYLQLIIARSKDNLSLLLTLGYSPRWLSRNVSNRFLPVYIFIVIIALALAQVLQWVFYRFVMKEKPGLSPFIHWSIGATAFILIILAMWTNFNMVRKQLNKLN